MTFVVTDACVKCKYTDCVEVCPVDCFHEGKEMLIIHPDKCIDCGVCTSECPVEAIKSEDEVQIDLLEFARYYCNEWPSITRKKIPPPDADLYKNETDKLEKYMGIRFTKIK